MRWLVLGLAIVATPAAADQFDLICTAKKTQMRYRIDLARGEWCNEDCGEVRKVASVTSGVIALAEVEPAPPENRRAYIRINRVSGEWEWYNRDPRYITVTDVRGSCVPQPFSGFPGAKF